MVKLLELEGEELLIICDKVMMELMYLLGLRISELVGVNI